MSAPTLNTGAGGTTRPPAGITLQPVPTARGAAAAVPHGAEEIRLRSVPFRLALFGLAMFVTGAVLLVMWPDVLTSPDRYATYHGLGMTHVIALGFVSSLVLGVLYQFIPANFHTNVRGVRRAKAVTIAYPAAVLLFAVALSTGSLWIAAVAGPLLAVAVALFLSQMASVIMRAKRRTLEGGFHITAFVALSVVITLGSLLATSLPTAWIHDPGRWLAAKIFIAVAGWLGMIVAGVSYHTVRGLNASAVRPRFVLPALVSAVTGIAVTPVLILAGAPATLRAASASLLVIAALMVAADVVRTVRGRGPRAAGVTWAGHCLSALLVVAAAVEGVAAMAAGPVWAAAAVCLFLLGAAPVAIIANGNRIVSVLIANRFDGRGRGPLSGDAWGRVLMPVALSSVVASVAAVQTGIVAGVEPAIRAGALLLLVAAAAVAVTAARKVLSSRREARAGRFEVSDGRA